MQLDVTDFVILNASKDKKVYSKIISLNPNKAVVCDRFQKNKNRASYLEFEKEDVVANLGKTPFYGSAYNVNIEHVRFHLMNVGQFNDVYVYKKVTETEMSLLKKSLIKVSAELVKAKIFPKEKPIDVFVKERKGLAGAMYTHNRKETINDILTIRTGDYSNLDYFVRHELGHGFWFQIMSDSEKSKWIRSFYKNITLKEDIDKKIKTMRKELVEARSIKAYKSDLDDDDKDIFEHIIKYVEVTYSVKPMHINILIEDGDDLTDIWPTGVLDIPQTKVLVSEYGTSDPEEYFCDSFAFYFDEDKILPKSIKALLENTISVCKYSKSDK